MNKPLIYLIFILVFLMTQRGSAQVTPTGPTASDLVGKPIPPQRLLRQLVGEWTGTCRTWTEPGKLADESFVNGKFEEVLGNRFVRHTYQSSMGGEPREGEEMIAYNSLSQSFQVSWIDGFHMNYGIMFSEGKSMEEGFSVTGNYDVRPNQPQWKWRTEYRLLDTDNLVITAYNIHPEGLEAVAIETKYKRKKQ